VIGWKIAHGENNQVDFTKARTSNENKSNLENHLRSSSSLGVHQLNHNNSKILEKIQNSVVDRPIEPKESD
jgi:hypothetical protein